MFKTWLIRASLFAVFIIALVKPLIEQQQYQVADKQDDQVSAKSQVEQPLHNVDLPEFADIKDVKQKKKQFFAFIKPAIDDENDRISRLRKQLFVIEQKLVQSQALTAEESQLMQQLAKKYKVSKKLSPVDKIKELLTRVDIVPKELILVQAANESAWGTSRFARIGLNFFGIWCYKKGCGMVPNGRDEGLKHEVAAFQSVEKAVQHYLFNINTNAAYRVFRIIRSQLRQQDKPLSAQILATGLLPYSERGTDYVLEISEMIRHNQRYFDSYASE
ncbi:glycoside hydrolase family 73 [Thalassotalea insulae]|uniref:Glycoside hydrolase family 73 n=1 Tax=Thalassotalea insulae TaxID=2056778 RepID=A0ABQ6H0S3_9GAMM|nr:glucosaminidase domain-containing protein [Thalassotalea insulae]GLX80476.1 glycoside hydrolase family 73 [Thalassotalea insulae]